MLLVTAATSFEMEAFARACPSHIPHQWLITGVGPVETTLRLSTLLATNSTSFRAVFNFGIAGAYCREQDPAGLLDLCLAESETLGDLGICTADSLERLDGALLDIQDHFILDQALLTKAETLLRAAGLQPRLGPFITVSCVSGNKQRGELLWRAHQGLCENMEGAAAARVCSHFHLPLLELRCISNLVTDRDRQGWQIRRACIRCGEAAALVLEGIAHG